MQTTVPDARTRGAARTWALLPWALLPAALAALAHGSTIDTALADTLFAWEGHRWALADNPIARGLLHDAGQMASKLAWLGVVLAWAATHAVGCWRRHRQPLARLAVSVLVATALVATLKQLMAVHCPWDLVRYGGTAMAGDGGGACFPAGHAAAGYAWLALAFVPATPSRRRIGLAAGLGAGLVFGIDQQLRGAHFLSHDLWSAALCWMVAVVVAGLWPTPSETAP
ncbi:membrane protein [Luteimonas terricola]|uniref:Membrane protein n=2 Tax=Luteimonas terricola TaxID=645597 RepID=A0ABQ2EJY3_9GAMM|nr:membrane protein [Luteimonas terricola]